MLTIHEKAKSEMGLWNILIICLSVFFFEFQELILAKVEDQARHRESNHATHTHIRQEMLRKVDARVGAQGCKNQQHQHRRIDQEPRPVVVLSGF